MNEMFKDLMESPVPKTTQMESIMRDIGHLIDSSGFTLYFKRQPLISELQMYDIKLGRKGKEGKVHVYYHDEGMELMSMFKRLKKYLDRWYEDHRDYNIQKPGGGGYL